MFIPYNPINGLRNHTLNLWVKDFGSGPIFQAYDNNLYAPTLYITEEVKARAYGISDIKFISYHDFVTSYEPGNIVIDEAE